MPFHSYRALSEAQQQQQPFIMSGQAHQQQPFGAMTNPHESHPALGHLILLVFEAVMEVVCVSLPGYIIARLGHFDVEKQKFLANLNVMLFTPCLSMRITPGHKPTFERWLHTRAKPSG